MAQQIEFIPYEQALELKQLGFDMPCFAYWNIDPYLPKPTFNLVKPFDHEWCIPAPIHQQAFRWLYHELGIENGVMPLDIESQKLLLNKLVDNLSSKRLLV